MNSSGDNPAGKPVVIKTDDVWRAQLTPEQYHVMRMHGTEPPFSHPHNNEKSAGTYNCAGCGPPLFSSEAKFDSGTGWPSYFQPVDPDARSRIVHEADRNPLCPLRGASWSRFSGRSATYRTALLHERLSA
jgi:hypothetical protein